MGVCPRVKDEGGLLRVPNGRGGWTERNAAAPYFWSALQLVGDGR